RQNRGGGEGTDVGTAGAFEGEHSTGGRNPAGGKNGAVFTLDAELRRHGDGRSSGSGDGEGAGVETSDAECASGDDRVHRASAGRASPAAAGGSREKSCDFRKAAAGIVGDGEDSLGVSRVGLNQS